MCAITIGGQGLGHAGTLDVVSMSKAACTVMLEKAGVMRTCPRLHCASVRLAIPIGLSCVSSLTHVHACRNCAKLCCTSMNIYDEGSSERARAREREREREERAPGRREGRLLGLCTCT